MTNLISPIAPFSPWAPLSPVGPRCPIGPGGPTNLPDLTSEITNFSKCFLIYITQIMLKNVEIVGKADRTVWYSTYLNSTACFSKRT